MEGALFCALGWFPKRQWEKAGVRSGSGKTLPRCHPEKVSFRPAGCFLAVAILLVCAVAGGKAAKAAVIFADASQDAGPPATSPTDSNNSRITLTDIIFPDGQGFGFGTIGPLLYSERGEGFWLRSIGPLDSLGASLTADAFLNRLALDSLYVSVQSLPDFTVGEIRGQVVVIPEPAGLALLGFGLVLLLLARMIRRGSGIHRSSQRPSSLVRRKTDLPERR